MIFEHFLTGNSNQYSIQKLISDGSFGKFYKAYDNISKMEVAMKSVNLDVIYNHKIAYRELCVLHHVKSHYLSKLIDSQKVLKDGEIMSVIFVFPLMEYDLNRIIYEMELNFSFDAIIKIIYQILKGLQYLFDAGIIHRDLKPSNVGMNTNYDIRILEFGRSREEHESMTKCVTTAYYRAIDVACTKDYTAAIDMWSAGCILTELFTRKVLFKGKSIFGQVYAILKITGLPEEGLFPDLNSTGKDIPKENQLKPHIYKEIFEFVCQDNNNEEEIKSVDNVINLICHMLDLNPKKRATPSEALQSALFTQHYHLVKGYPDDEKATIFECDCSRDSLECLKEKITNEIDRHFGAD